MHSCDNTTILKFDRLYTTSQIQRLKILLPYIQKDYQSILSFYIKMNELKYSITLLNRKISLIPQEQEIDFSSLSDALFPYCSEEEKEMLRSFRQMKEQLKNFQTMEEQMEQMKQFQEMMNMMDMFNEEEKNKGE